MGRIARIVGGFALILIGIPLLVLPGPGFLSIFAGITLIATEFEWASAISEWAKAKLARIRHSDNNPPSN